MPLRRLTSSTRPGDAHALRRATTPATTEETPMPVRRM